MHFVVLLTALVACAVGVPFNSTEPKLEGRILHGTETDIKDIPYQLSLSIDGNFTCGAVIIGPTWALTAAHCVKGVDAGRITLRAGSIYTDRSGSEHSVTNVIVHDGFNRTGRVENDIALLQVVPEFGQTDAEKGIPLHGGSAPIDFPPFAYVSGWGMTESGHRSTTLKRVVVRILPRHVCCQLHENISGDMLCIIGADGEGSGKGDSGGLLVDSQTARLIGLVSWGTVYTSIPALRGWVRDNSGIEATTVE